MTRPASHCAPGAGSPTARHRLPGCGTQVLALFCAAALLSLGLALPGTTSAQGSEVEIWSADLTSGSFAVFDPMEDEEVDKFFGYDDLEEKYGELSPGSFQFRGETYGINVLREQTSNSELHLKLNPDGEALFKGLQESDRFTLYINDHAFPFRRATFDSNLLDGAFKWTGVDVFSPREDEVLGDPRIFRVRITSKLRGTNVGVYPARLMDANGENTSAGRVEVQYNGEWGRVCDDRQGPGNRAPQMFCKKLGRAHGEWIPNPRAQMGSLYETSPPGRRSWLDDLRCSSNNPGDDCYHAGWGNSNCTRDEDMWVRCWDGDDDPGTGPAPMRAWIENGAAGWLRIMLDDSIAGGSETKPSKNRFAVTVDGNAVTVDSVEVYSSVRILRVVLSKEVRYGQTVTVSYTDPDPGNDNASGVLEDRFGNDAASFTDFAVDNQVQDGIAPQMTGGEVSQDGMSVMLWLTEPLDRNTLPDTDRFTVRFVTTEIVAVDRDGQPGSQVIETNLDLTPSAVAFASASELPSDARVRSYAECADAPETCALKLTMKRPIRGQDKKNINGRLTPLRSGHKVVKVRYADRDTSRNDTSGVVQDPAGNDLRTTYYLPVANNSRYNLGSVVYGFVSSEDPSTSTLVFERAFDVSDFPSGSELRSAFSMTLDGAPLQITFIGRDSSDNRRLNFEHNPAVPGDRVTMSYTKPTSGRVLKDSRGRDVASFTDFEMANDTFGLDLKFALLTSPTSIDLQMSEDMDPTSVPPLDSFTIQVAGSDQTPNSIEFNPDGDATIVRLHLSTAVASGQSVQLTYSRPSSGPALRSLDGVELLNVTEDVLRPGPRFSINDVSVTEGEDATADFIITLMPAATARVTVDYATTDSGARAPEDYTETSGTLTFNAGETEQTVSVPIIDDSLEDDNEFFLLELSNASGGNAVIGDSIGAAQIRNDEGLTEETTEETTEEPTQDLTSLTAELSGVPASHGGLPFTVELAFSEEFKLSYKLLQGADGQSSAIQVTNGEVKRAERVEAGKNQRWTLTIEPDASGDVTLTLPATTDCEADDAICTEDDRPLSAAVTAAVPNQVPSDTSQQTTPLTVSLAQVPAEHDGESDLVFQVQFSEAPHNYSFRTLRDHTLDIRQGGTAITPHVKRISGTSNRDWQVTVEPVSREDLTIEVSAPETCSESEAVCTEGGVALSNSASATVLGPPGLSVSDATVAEDAGASMDFSVTMSRASSSTVTVDYATSDGSALAGSDYTSTSGTVSFSPGETLKTVSVPVLDDAIDDNNETFTLTLSNASGGNAWLSDSSATGTIENDDPMPQAWLARFGRTVASQAVDAIGERMRSSDHTEITLGGRSLSFSSAATTHEAQGTIEDHLRRLADSGSGDIRDNLNNLNGLGGSGSLAASGSVAHGFTGRSMAARELLLGSAFQFSTSDGAGGPALTAWGRVAGDGFDAQVDGTHLDGTVTTGFLGADVRRGRWLAGLALSLSEGEGGYALTQGEDRGQIENSLASLLPYARFALTDRVDLWGLTGFGEGELSLRQHANANRSAEQNYTTDISMRMGAIGLRGELLSPSNAGGISLAVKSDAFWVRTTSEAVSGPSGNLGASEADASRIRLLVEGSRRFDTSRGALTPSIELGIRHDGGDAETGTGVEAGASLRYSGRGFSIKGSLRTLVVHEESGYEEWSASGAVRIDPGQSGRGFSLSLAPSWGAQNSGGSDRLWSVVDARRLAPGHEPNVGGRLEAELGYGLGLRSAPGVLTPFAGMSMDGDARSWRTGAHWAVAQDASLVLEATRRETSNDLAPPEHALMLRGELRW